MTKIGDNPNDTLPAGKPLDPDRIVSEGDAGSAEIERELQEERDEQTVADEADEADGTSRTEADEEQPGLA